MIADPLYVDSEPWPDPGPDVTEGVVLWTGRWTVATAVVAAALVVVLIVRRR